MKFEGKATDVETRNIFVFLIPFTETKSILPELNMEMVTGPIVTRINADRQMQLEMNCRIDDESAATIIIIGAYMALMSYLPSIRNSSSPIFS